MAFSQEISWNFPPPFRSRGVATLFGGQNGGNKAFRLAGAARGHQGGARQYPHDAQEIPSLHPTLPLLVAGGRGTGARWQDTPPPISSEPTLRIFFIAPTIPWQFSQSPPALTCRLWEK